jgi:MFS family permease
MHTVGNVYAIAAVAVVGGALFGFDISSMSAIISTKAYLCYFNQGPLYLETDGKCSGPTAEVQGIPNPFVHLTAPLITLSSGGITASMPAGSWLGALISGYLSDILGRKKAIQIGAIIWCIGSILVCASNGIPMLIVGRIVNGFSVGICSAQVPVYITEIAPPSKRGRLVGSQQCKSFLTMLDLN